MLLVAIILAFILIYLINSQNVSKENPNPGPSVNRRVGGVFTYNDMFDITRDELPVNTVTGPGGASLVKKFV
jgi:hypothetical protein